MSEKPVPGDASLRALLRAARPDAPLPPRFEESVWRRLDAARPTRGAGVLAQRLDRVVTWLVRPRLALVGVAMLLLTGTLLGVVQGANLAHELAKERYLAAVSPLTPH